ncbi:insulinase (Peptidase family m16) domain-containing protein [Phthorimaea operculella]|nr:insulinase (Peptidase family m16) domain-containing protein [Phthorimaea operculella]
MLRLLIKQKPPLFITTRSLFKGGKSVPTGMPQECLPQQCKPKFGPPPVHSAKFINGITVQGYNPLGGSIGACTVMFHAGSRNEYDDTLGVTHFIRAGSGCSGCSHSGFMRARYLQQTGVYLTCTTNRQTIAFTLRCPEPTFASVKFFLTDLAAKCLYPDHELDEVRKIVRNDLEQRHPEQHVIDLVQKACFAGPLSNSIYCEEDRIDEIDSDTINKFIDCNFKTAVCSIGSANLHYSEVMKVAAHVDANREPPCSMMSCPRGGFEYEDTGPGGDTYMAIAVPGAGSGDSRCLIYAILAAACGNGNVYRGTHFWNRIQMNPIGSLPDSSDVVSGFKAFNISYLDTGCFGILVRTNTAMARRAGFKAVEFLTSLDKLSAAQIQTGKKRLKVATAFHMDSCVLASESMALQAANGLVVDNAMALGCLIDEITPGEVINAAKCVVASCMRGDTPYCAITTRMRAKRAQHFALKRHARRHTVLYHHYTYASEASLTFRVKKACEKTHNAVLSLHVMRAKRAQNFALQRNARRHTVLHHHYACYASEAS